MRDTTMLVWFVGLAGLAASALFAGAAAAHRPGRTWVATAAACAVGTWAGHRWLEVGIGWAAGALAVSAALSLAWGPAARLLAHLLLPTWTLGALAVHRSTPTGWGVGVGVAVLIVATLLALLFGIVARPLRERGWFVDLTLLAFLSGVALLAGPTALVAWRRAGVAAEGQDPAPDSAVVLWPLAAVASALVAGAAWRLYRARWGRKKGPS